MALYGGLCALASFDRQDLYTKVIASRYESLLPPLSPDFPDFPHSLTLQFIPIPSPHCCPSHPSSSPHTHTLSLILPLPSLSFPSSFKQFLELDPQLRDVITQFHQSRYTSCLRTLEDMRSTLMLDMYLSQHLHTLLTMIRNKALIQVCGGGSGEGWEGGRWEE